MKTTKRLLAVTVVVLLLVCVLPSAYATETIASLSEKFYSNKYTANASLVWSQEHIQMTAYTSSNAPSAAYATTVICDFVIYGIPFGGTQSQIGTTSATVYGVGTGFINASSGHEVHYANEMWKRVLTD